MTKVLAIVAASPLLSLVLGFPVVVEAAEGKQVFMDEKCNICHSVESEGIEKKMKGMNSPDLSSIGSEIESAEWLRGFLLQNETKDGEEHQRQFKGSDEELDALVNWIMSLQTS